MIEPLSAWQKAARDTERDYLSVKLDDPGFPAPIYTAPIEVEGRTPPAHLVPPPIGIKGSWRRPRRKAGRFLPGRRRRLPWRCSSPIGDTCPECPPEVG